MKREQYQQEREFEFTVKDFEKIRKLIYQRAGISLSQAKTDMVYSRVGRRLRANGYQSFNVYLGYLENHPKAEEWEAFTNALTTNLTSFFREPHHFPILAEHLLTLTTPIRIWCSAASTGEEPYTLAMTACEAFNTLKPPVEIIATDIDTNVLEAAISGVYPEDRLSKLSDNRRKRFFQRGTGANEGQVRIKKELRNLITFQPLNLLANEWSIDGKFDVMFCRNVMIYFDKPTQSTILKRFVPYMHGHTLLFAGHSENFLYVSKDFELLGKTVYQLRAQQSTAVKKAAA